MLLSKANSEPLTDDVVVPIAPRIADHLLNWELRQHRLTSTHLTFPSLPTGILSHLFDNCLLLPLRLRLYHASEMWMDRWERLAGSSYVPVAEAPRRPRLCWLLLMRRLICELIKNSRDGDSSHRWWASSCTEKRWSYKYEHRGAESANLCREQSWL